MIRTYQSGKVKRLGRGIDSYRSLFSIFADRLRRNMLIAAQNQIRPDLIRNHIHIMFSEQFHRLFQFPFFPHPAAGIVRRTKYRSVDLVFHDFFLHIFIIHAHNALFVLHQGGMYNRISVIFQTHGKANVGRGMKQYTVALRTQYIQCADNAPQNSVLITDALPG